LICIYHSNEKQKINGGVLKMAQTQTKAASRSRKGHAALEGTLSAPFLKFDLAEEIQQLRKEESWLGGNGRSSKTLVKYPDLRIVLVLMKPDTVMHEHKATARISVQTINGHIRLRLPDHTVELPAGHLLTLDQCISHDVEAEQESACLLTLSWPPETQVEECKTHSKRRH
jgi:quercetin dioxygenase-like cupin family protein